jgi:hypothetical protein
MSAILIKFGTTSGSLVTMPKSPAQEVLSEEFSEKIDVGYNFSGQVRVATTGARKKILSLNLKNVDQTQFATFSQYANIPKKWWVQITGVTGQDLLNSYAYIRFENIKIFWVDDTKIYRDFELKIYQI